MSDTDALTSSGYSAMQRTPYRVGQRAGRRRPAELACLGRQVVLAVTVTLITTAVLFAAVR